MQQTQLTQLTQLTTMTKLTTQIAQMPMPQIAQMPAAPQVPQTHFGRRHAKARRLRPLPWQSSLEAPQLRRQRLAIPDASACDLFCI
jgi:hypothetical protein